MISGSSSTIKTRLDTLAVYLTNSRAKHSLVTSRSSRAPPSRRRESAKIGATVEPQGSPRSHEEEPSMTTVGATMTTVGATAPAPLEELLRTRVARFVECVPDWDAFADARVEGYRRAQHRYIGAGASGETHVPPIPAQHFPPPGMFVPPGPGNPAPPPHGRGGVFVLP